MASIVLPAVPSESRSGRFGVYGGRYVPETLMAALVELEREYDLARPTRPFRRSWPTCCTTTRGGRRRSTIASA